MTIYKPGYYGKHRMGVSEWINSNIHKWESKQIEAKQKEIEAQQKKIEPKMVPCICISRKLGVGALEVADSVAKKLKYRVADREILEHIVKEADLHEKVVEVFDERYPGRMSEFLQMLFGEKAFIKSDYTRYLFGSVLSLSLEPTIFVGRGTHLILPRDNVFAVRLICSKSFRVKRVAEILNIDLQSAEQQLDTNDKEQRNFFYNTYRKKDAAAYEFDMVLNRDYIKEVDHLTELIATGFKQKFKL